MRTKEKTSQHREGAWTITNKGNKWWADNLRHPRVYAESLDELHEKIKRIERK